MWKKLLEEHTLVMYDGNCGFCDTTIQFILDNDPSDRLKFVSQQSEKGQELIRLLNIQGYETSIMVIQQNQYYKKSRAIFKITKELGTSWQYLSYLHMIPACISDGVYSILATYRYKLVRQYCRLITEKERGYFL